MPANANVDGIDANGDIVGVLRSGEQFQIVGGVVTEVPAPYFVNYNTISENGEVALIVAEISFGNIFVGFENLLATPTGRVGTTCEFASSFYRKWRQQRGSGGRV